MLDRVVEHVLAAGVSEGDELPIPFYTGWVDWAHVIVTDALTDFPEGVVLEVVGG